MKSRTGFRRPTQGSTLMLTVVVTALVGLVLVAYLSLIKHQNTINFRSQRWNSAMPLVEAGLEHALAHLTANLDMETGFGLDLARDGWVANGTGYTTTHRVGNDRYEVAILDYTPGKRNTPKIVSIGHVEAPLMAAAPAVAPGPFLAFAETGSPVSASQGAAATYLVRAVDVRCRLDPIWSKAMLAKDSLDIKGNDIRSDSFDSADPTMSVNGQYSPDRFRANGDIACNAGITNSIDVGNATIYGTVSTGPGGTVDLGPGGLVGDVTWTPTGDDRIQPGWFKDDMNVEFDPIIVPFNPDACLAPQPGWITNEVVHANTNMVYSPVYPVGVTSPITTNFTTAATYPPGVSPVITNTIIKNNTISYTYTYPVSYGYCPGGFITNTTAVYYDYVLTDNAGSESKWAIPNLVGTVYVSGNATLYVSTGINMTGQDVIHIGPNASLKLYMAGAKANLGGLGIVNEMGFATNFSYYGLPSNTSLSLAGNGTFTGTINAPQADLTLSGGGSTVTDIVGAAIAKTITLNGGFNCHFDESLTRGPVRGYIVAVWNELSPQQVNGFVSSAPAPLALPDVQPMP